MVERLKVLVLDEPTRGIDVTTKAQFHDIIRALAADGLAVVVISSDLPEVFAVADRIVVMRQGRIAASFVNDGSVRPEEVLRYAVSAGVASEVASTGTTSVEAGGGDAQIAEPGQASPRPQEVNEQ